MKIKKLIAAVVAFAMLTVFVQPCFAVSIAEITDFISNPFNLPQMSMQVTARESGVGDYTSSLAVTSATASSVDYKATLDMSTVRDLFDEGFLTVLIPGDPQLQSEYNSAKVSTTVDVVIDYPATANIAGDLNSVGYLDAGSIFSEKSRNVSDNKVTITYVNRDGLTAEELTANVDTYLKDISFYLDGSVSYSTEGSHIVTVTMSGSTKVEFSSKTQTINYYGGSSQITNFSKAIVEHVLEIVPLKPATCDEVGYTESVKCATHNSYDCDINYGVNGIVRPVQLPVLDHKISGISVKIDIPEVPATCASTGVKAHKMCALCKQDFDINTGVEVSHEELIIPVLPNHTGLVTIPGQDADCIKDGLTDGQKCTTCGKITQVQTVIPALGHSLVDIPGFAPTCYSVGISTGKRCQRPGCGLVIVAQEIIPATGHNMGEWVVITPATENSEGKKERSCLNNCGYKEEVTIPKEVHVHKAEPKMDVILQAATCTEPGKKQQYCSCGLKYGSEVVIPARGHHAKPDDMLYVSHMPATCSETGRVEHYICPDCNKLFRDADAKIEIASAVIPKDKDNHAGGEVIMPAVKATCTTEGLTEGKKCNKCKIITVKQQKVDRLWDDVTTWVEEAATCEESGVLGHWHCTICNKDFMSVAKDEISSDELVVAAKGHHYGAWSDPYVNSSDGKTYRKRVCQVCFKEDICEVEPGQHQHNETRWEIIKEATLTETGLMRKVHSCCGEVIEDNVVIPKKEHKLVFVPAVDATCFSEGTAAYWKCQECQKKFSTHDRTQEITDPEDLVLSMLVHEFVNKGHYNECKHCGERVHIVKPNEVQVEIDKHGGIKEEEDRIRERSININSDDNVKIEAEFIIEPLAEVSPELDEHIHRNVSSENTEIEKVAYDITIEKVTTYTNKDDKDREKVTETDDLVTIIITIPQNMRSMKDFAVHRKHGDHTDIIKTTPNAHSEYIEINRGNWEITLHAKRFSEYAVVGYSEIVNDTPIVGGDDDAGPSATNKYTVKFNTNGGTKVNNVMVNHGSTVAAPETIRDGYTFDGWYTDYELTIPYDFDTPVTYSLTLYAKWIKDKGIGDLVIDDESCGGFLDEGCPHHDYDDIDPEMWYHYGIDFVLDNKLMIGVADGEFAPDLSVTRGMLVTVLYRAEGEPTAPAYVSFDDLNVGDYYVDAVKWAAEHGIVLGYSDSVYAPDDVITREQIAAIMHRYAKFKGFDVSVGETTSITSYADYDSISEYAIPSLQYAVGSGLMKGRTETTLNPREDTTRAEMATILYRFFRENLPTVALEQETK